MYVTKKKGHYWPCTQILIVRVSLTSNFYSCENCMKYFFVKVDLVNILLHMFFDMFGVQAKCLSNFVCHDLICPREQNLLFNHLNDIQTKINIYLNMFFLFA